MDVARLNFSHGNHADHKHVYQMIREASDETGRAVGILADLQGPKIRLGRFAVGPVEWRTGDVVRVTSRRGPMTLPAKGVSPIPPEPVFIPHHLAGRPAANHPTKPPL